MFVGFFSLITIKNRVFYQCPNRSSLKLGGIQNSDLVAGLPLLHMHKNASLSFVKISFFLRWELQIPLLPFTLRRTLLPEQCHLIQNKQQDIQNIP